MEEFPNEQVLALKIAKFPWYADVMNYLMSKVFPPNANSQEKKRLAHDAKYYVWDEPYLFKQGIDKMVRRCVLEVET